MTSQWPHPCYVPAHRLALQSVWGWVAQGATSPAPVEEAADALQNVGLKSSTSKAAKKEKKRKHERKQEGASDVSLEAATHAEDRQIEKAGSDAGMGVPKKRKRSQENGDVVKIEEAGTKVAGTKVVEVATNKKKRKFENPSLASQEAATDATPAAAPGEVKEDGITEMVG